MRFDEAMRLLWTNRKLTRADWNDKGQYVFLVMTWDFTTYTEGVREPGLASRTVPFLAINTSRGQILPYSPTHGDMTANDWDLI